MRNSDRIIVNTVILYAKMVISIIISLYSTRLILQALGAEDYGIYVIIGGVISMLGFLNVTMTTSTQRHLSFSMGKNDISEVRKVFANSILLHFFLGIILVIAFEVAGFYLLTEKLQIDESKIQTAKILYHFVVLSTFITIIAVPYDAIVNAKENMLFLSITGVLDSVLKLVIAILLFVPYFEDKLLIFGFLMLLKAIFLRLIKQVYCLYKYRKECKVQFIKSYDKKVMKELYSFASWNLIGVVAYIFRNQGVAVVLNLFFGTIVNAAYGIANQVNSQLRLFSEAMLQSIQPQMMKNEGGGDRSRVLRLAIISSKFSFIIFSFFAIPLFLELEFIIDLWLVEVPPSTIIFCKLMIILTLIQQFRSGITIATHAIGKIKEYQFFNAPVQLMSLPLGYFLLYIGLPSYYIVIAVIFVESITVFLNILFFKKLTQFSPLKYIKDVLLNCSLSFLLSLVLVYVIQALLNEVVEDYFRVILIFPISMMLYAIIIYFFNFNIEEKSKIKIIMNSLLAKK